MKIGSIYLNPQFLILVLVITILNGVCLDSVSALCEFSVKDKNKLYNYSLADPLRKFPHGIRSEDGFYKVSANGTVLWFQLCGSMIFNHDPPMCVGCKDCGGSSRCGMGCSALVSNKMEGYPVCTTLGHSSTMLMDVIDRKNPHTGITVKMTNNGPKHNCSLSVSVICKSNGVQAPQTFETVGFCDYTAELKHPSGCAKIISSHGSGLGWFGTLMIIVLCLFGVYLLAGAVYRYYFLRIRGIDEHTKMIAFNDVIRGELYVDYWHASVLFYYTPFRSFPTWNFGLAYRREYRECISHWFKDSEDLQWVTGALILQSIFD